MDSLAAPRAGLEALAIMQERGVLPGQAWHAYQNQDLGSRDIGHIKFVKIGVACTLPAPPPHYPDDSVSQGHAYRHVGVVDLVTGEVKPCT